MAHQTADEVVLNDYMFEGSGNLQETPSSVISAILQE